MSDNHLCLTRPRRWTSLGAYGVFLPESAVRLYDSAPWVDTEESDEEWRERLRLTEPYGSFVDEDEDDDWEFGYCRECGEALPEDASHLKQFCNDTHRKRFARREGR